MNDAVLEFVRRHLSVGDVFGKRVLEVGSLDVNGSPRGVVQALGPLEYIGVDLQEGRGVDRTVEAEKLVAEFGNNSFDVVLSTEMVEHLVDWKTAFSQMKRVLRPRGVIIVTTRSPGFKYHPYPIDCWRYTINDMAAIFADMKGVVTEMDPLAPGVFVRALKPEQFTEGDLSTMKLESARKP